MRKTVKLFVTFIIVVAVLAAVTVSAFAAYQFGAFNTPEGFNGTYTASLLISEDDVEASLEVRIKNSFYPLESTILRGEVTGINTKNGDLEVICYPQGVGDTSCFYEYKITGPYKYIKGTCDYVFYTKQLCTLTA